MSTYSGPNIVEDGLILSLDAANQKSYSPNLVDSSIYNSSKWSNLFPANASITTGISDPYGSNTAIRLTCTTSGSSLLRVSFPSFIPNGIDNYTISFYVKKISGTVSTSNQLFCDLHDGTPSINYLPHLITNEWVRVSATNIASSSTKTFIDLLSDNTNNYILDFWGVQIEKSSSVTTFNPNYYGTSIKDTSNNLNNGTVSQNLLFNSLNNGSLQYLSASSTNISFLNSSSLQFLNVSPYTLEAWVYPTVNPGANNWTGIFDRESNPGSGRDGYNLYFLGSAGSNTYFTSERFCSGVNTQVSVTLDQSLSVNNWQHFIVTYNGATMTLYRNGTSVSTNTSTGNITNTSKALTIGLRGGQYFTGRIGATNTYNVALTSSQVLQNFNALRGRYGI